MKMPKELFGRIEEAITPLDTAHRRHLYETGAFPRSDRTRDLNMRYRWDLLWVAVDAGLLEHKMLDGLNDDHVDTALRRIVPALFQNDWRDER